MDSPALLVAALVAAAAFAATMVATSGDGDEPERTESAVAGLAVFNRMGCGSCHRLAAAGSNGPIGPSLDERLKGHTAASLKARILSPAPGTAMPEAFGQRMSDAELDALVGFLLDARR